MSSHKSAHIRRECESSKEWNVQRSAPALATRYVALFTVAYPKYDINVLTTVLPALPAGLFRDIQKLDSILELYHLFLRLTILPIHWLTFKFSLSVFLRLQQILAIEPSRSSTIHVGTTRLMPQNQSLALFGYELLATKTCYFYVNNTCGVRATTQKRNKVSC